MLRDHPVLAHCVPVADISSSQLERNPLRLAGTQLDVIEPTENTKRVLLTPELDVLEWECQFVCPRCPKVGQESKRGGGEEGSKDFDDTCIYIHINLPVGVFLFQPLSRYF